MAFAQSISAVCPHCQLAVNLDGCEPLSQVLCIHCGATIIVDQIIGNFEIREPISYGTSATVYRAKDLKLEREVVVQLFSAPDLANVTLLQQLKIEAAALARMNHPNIVPIYSSGVHRRRFYMVMPWMEYGTLLERIERGGRLAEEEALAVFKQVAAGLHEARTCDVLHRNISPVTIFFSGPDTAMIGGFGKSTGSDLETLVCVAPEILQGKTNDVFSDIYSFGVTFLWALSGQFPFAISDANPVSVHSLKMRPVVIPKTISQATAGLIRRAMSKDPSGRFHSYEEIIARLESAQMQLADSAKVQRPATTPVAIPAAVQGESSPRRGHAGKSIIAASGVTLSMVVAVWLTRDHWMHRQAVANMTPAGLPLQHSEPSLSGLKQSDSGEEPFWAKPAGSKGKVPAPHSSNPFENPPRAFGKDVIEKNTIPAERRVSLAEGVYTIRNHKTGLYLTWDSTDSSRWKLTEAAYQALPEQQWVVVANGNGSYHLHPLNTERLLDLTSIVWGWTFLVVPEDKKPLVQNWIITQTELKDYYGIVSETGLSWINSYFGDPNQYADKVGLRQRSVKSIQWWKFQAVPAQKPG